MSTRVYAAAEVAPHPNGTPPMLVIRRTDTGGLRVSDGRRTDTAATEEHARRVVTAWGYGNFSFNRALILMKESEGSIAPVANPWLARRGAESSAPAASAVATPHAETKPEPAAPGSLKEPPTMNVPARSRRPRAAGLPAPGETAAAPASPVVTADAPVAETALRPRRARKARPADAEPSSPVVGETHQEPVAETSVPEAPVGHAPVADVPVAALPSAPTEVPAKAANGTRPRRARKPNAPASEPAAEAPRAAVEPSTVAETATAPDQGQGTAPARRRGRRPKAESTAAADVQPAAPAEAVPDPVSEPVSEVSTPSPSAVSAEPGAAAAPRPRRPRAPRRVAAEEAPAQPAAESAAPAPAGAGAQAPSPKAERARFRAAARTPEEWLEAARVLFAEGTQALREIESATLPFARGPWTELRTQSAEILACLQGKKPDRS